MSTIPQDQIYGADTARIWRLAEQARACPQMFPPGAEAGYRADLASRLAAAAADRAAGRTVEGLARQTAAVVVTSEDAARAEPVFRGLQWRSEDGRFSYQPGPNGWASFAGSNEQS